jgi:hypothetical protein
MVHTLALVALVGVVGLVWAQLRECLVNDKHDGRRHCRTVDGIVGGAH